MGASVIVGVTGASGSIYAARFLRALERSPDVERVSLVVTRHARVAIREELGIPSDGPLDLKRLAGLEPEKVRLFDVDEVEAPIASGSHRVRGMVVVPCSMGTLAKIAHGTSDSLLTRAADVTLKEGRKLLLAVRETPLSKVHLANLLRAAEVGATIVPAMPAFYGKPATIEEMVDHFLARLLDHLDVRHDLGRRWREDDPPRG